MNLGFSKVFLYICNMKIKVKKSYDYDISLCDGENPYQDEYWEEMDVTTEELFDLINEGKHIKVKINF